MTEIRTESHAVQVDPQRAVEGSFGEGSHGDSPSEKPSLTLTARLRRGFTSPSLSPSASHGIDRPSRFWTLVALVFLLMGAMYATWTMLE
jgi:hypothetical protein